jgi:uncharacterized membrane protein YoaK (UPF0700 family)
MNVVWTVGKGVIIGAITAFVGYVKNMPDGEAVDWRKYTPTLIIGAITGAVAAGFGIELVGAAALVASFGVVSFVNTLWSYLVKERRNALARKSAKKAVKK